MPDLTIIDHLEAARTKSMKRNAQLTVMIYAMENLLNVIPPTFSHPIGAPHSPARKEQDAYNQAVAGARHALAVAKGQP